MKAWLKGGIIGVVIWLIGFSIFSIIEGDLKYGIGNSLIRIIISLILSFFIGVITLLVIIKIKSKNESPHWLRGGTIVPIIFLAYFLITYLVAMSMKSCAWYIFNDSGCSMYFIWLNLPLGLISGLLFHQSSSLGFLFMSLIIGFILGAIIGLIIGKIKSKKQVQQTIQKNKQPLTTQ